MTVSKYVNRDPNLLNCPCCGSIAMFIHKDGDETVDYGQIFCTNSECFICTPYNTYNACRILWNRRVEFAKHLLEWF